MDESVKALLGVMKAMANSQEAVHIAEVVRHGEKIILPTGMKTKDAITSLQRQLKYDEEVVALNFEFDYFVYDGAYALAQVMKARYGFVFGETTYSFWEGRKPPQLIGIETSRGVTEHVPWGKFTIPAIEEGSFECGYAVKEGRIIFKLIVTCKHMFEEEIKALRDGIEEYLKTHSIYKGKAFSVRFTDEAGQKLIDQGVLPTPKFLDLSKSREHELVFPKAVDEAITTNLFTPIDRIDEVRKLGVPIKRGILLAGKFGVGKTLTAYVAASKAVKKNITYIYCQNPQEFADVMRFAVTYAPALVFCEDVDRIIPLNRDKSVDQLVNIIDGVETKNSEIITVFTTNEIQNINKVLLRPGRMDAVIRIDCPDKEAVIRLMHNYAGNWIKQGTDLSKVGDLLAGNIPAVISEVCQRSKLSAIRLLKEGEDLKFIPAAAFEEAATTMKMQLELLETTTPAPKGEQAAAVHAVAASLESIAGALSQTKGSNGTAPTVVVPPKRNKASVATS